MEEESFKEKNWLPFCLPGQFTARYRFKLGDIWFCNLTEPILPKTSHVIGENPRG